MSKIIALAHAHKDVLVQERGARVDKVTIVENGIDVDLFVKKNVPNWKREQLELPNGVPLVGIVARLVPAKRLDIYLQAAKHLTKLFPCVNFIIVGDGEERQRLECLAEQLGIDKQVHFLGKRNDIAEILSIFDIAVMASDPIFETFPLVILEYMAAAKPVVASRVGSVSEIVVDGKTGILVSPGDADGLATAIAELLQNPDRALLMGLAGRNRVIANFSTRTMVLKTEQIFTYLLQDNIEEAQ